MGYVTLRQLRLGWVVEHGRSVVANLDGGPEAWIDEYWFLTRRNAERFKRALVDAMDREWT